MNVIYPGLECAIGNVGYEEALQRLLCLVTTPLSSHSVRAAKCPGRILAEPVVARVDLPGFDQSAMDGYAITAGDTAMEGRVPVVGRTAAGEAPGRVAANQACRIFTGAAMPYGADTVIAQENVRIVENDVIAFAAPPTGANVRRQGEDVRTGDVLIPPGTVLDWRHLTMLSAQGIGNVRVRRRVRAAVISNGNELGTASDLKQGHKYDSNLPMLTSLLAAWGAKVQTTLVIKDDAMNMPAAIGRVSDGVDLVVTTAGISVGEEDHVIQAVRSAGGWLTSLKVALKPGKPLVFGKLGKATFLGLPGNPLAALAGAVGFLQPLLARMTGAKPQALCIARSYTTIRHKPGRSEFVPVQLWSTDGCLWAEMAGRPGSGRIRPILAAEGFAFIRADQGDIGHADVIPVIRLPVLPPSLPPDHSSMHEAR